MPARKTKSGAKKPPKKKAAATRKTPKSTSRKASKSTRSGKAAKATPGGRKSAKKTAAKSSKKATAGKTPAKKTTRSTKRETPPTPRKATAKATTRKAPRKAPAKSRGTTKAAKTARGAAKKPARKTPPARAKPTKKETRPKATKSTKKASDATPAPPARAKKATTAPKRTAAKTAAPAPQKRAKKAPPTFVPPVTPVVKPLGRGGGAPAAAAEAAPRKMGHVDAQLVSAVHYGVFAAINKTFGRFGEKMVKNAALRFLEYGYKKAWLPPSAKDPVRALNEFLSRLEAMGYAESLKAQKKGDAYACEVTGLADWDAVHELKELHYPLLPVLLPEIIHAFLDQYFNLIVALESTELLPEKRGLRIPFTMHERQRKEPALSNVPERPATAYYDLDE